MTDVRIVHWSKLAGSSPCWATRHGSRSSFVHCRHCWRLSASSRIEAFAVFGSCSGRDANPGYVVFDCFIFQIKRPPYSLYCNNHENLLVLIWTQSSEFLGLSPCNRASKAGCVESQRTRSSKLWSQAIRIDAQGCLS